MKTKALGAVLGLALAALFMAPPAAEAGSRYSRSCRRGPSYSSSYRHYSGYGNGYYGGAYYPSYGYGYYPSYAYAPPPPVYYARPYPNYGYGYGSGYGSGYGYAYGPSYGPRVAFHYHGGVRCSRSHVSVHSGY